MTTTDITLAQFIDWMTSQEDIEVGTRINMLEHIQTKGFDATTISFIDKYMNDTSARWDQEINELEDELQENQVQLAREKNPQTSSRNRVQKSLKSYLTNLVDNFKTGFKDFELKQSAQEETSEHAAELDQVAALKAAL